MTRVADLRGASEAARVDAVLVIQKAAEAEARRQVQQCQRRDHNREAPTDERPSAEKCERGEQQKNAAETLREVVWARVVLAGVDGDTQRWANQARVQALKTGQPRIETACEQYRADGNDDDRLLNQQRGADAADNGDLVEAQGVRIECWG